MEVSHVTKEDLQHLQSLQSVLKAAKIEIVPTEAAAIGAVLAWYVDLCARAGKSWATEPRGVSNV